MKTRILGFAAILILALSCVDANRSYVRKAVRIMDRQGIFAEGAEWESARKAALSAQPGSIAEAQEIVREALRVAGGKHSFLKTEESVANDAHADWPAPTVSLEEDGIAVLLLPPFGGNREEGVKYARTVLEGIPEDVRGVVIDLRDNTGGDMYPMIAAVHRFIEDEDILRFRTRKRTQWIPLSFVIQGAGISRMSRIECPVALLTNGLTASSGEATLLCFRGLDYARSFGLPTAGYASANMPFTLPDGAQLVLTTGCDVARTGEVFCNDPIEPDVLTETPLEDALAWLRSQPSANIGDTD